MAKATGGGKATHSGIDFQNLTAAWFGVQILAEAARSFDLPAGVNLDSIWCETDQPVDDLLVRTSDDGCLFLQAKYTINLTKGDDSELASVVDQFTRQYLAARDSRPGAIPTGRMLDPARDRLIIVTSSRSSARVRSNLSDFLRRLRELEPHRRGTAVESAARNEEEGNAVSVVRNHLARSWKNAIGADPSEAEIGSVLELVHILVLDLDPGETHEREARHLLSGTILRRAADADAAWSTLVKSLAQCAKRQSGADHRGLQKILQDAGHGLAAVQTYRADIHCLREFSQSTSEQLVQLSKVNVGATEVRISRPCTSALVDAAPAGPLVVVGEPGAGKSATLHEAVRLLQGKGHDVVYLAADSLAAASLGQLRTELGLEHEFVSVLDNWPGTGPAFLVIDALDAARSDGSARTLRDLIDATIRLGSRWKVVASIREFDLRHSTELSKLFAGSPVSGFSQTLFGSVRHLAVPRLTIEELGQARTQAPELGVLMDQADERLRELARIAFNLRLMGELLGEGVPTRELTPIRTQLELLDRYWSRRVIRDDRLGDAREAVLRLVSDEMVRRRSLRARRAVVVGDDPSMSKPLGDVLSAGVLAEVHSPGRARPVRDLLAYSHHVLHDYAIARLLLRGDADSLTERLVASPDLAMTIRPSLVMHFQHLWSLDADHREFWEISQSVQRASAVPEIGKTIGPVVAAEFLRSPSDIDPLVALLEDPATIGRDSVITFLAYMVRVLLARPEDLHQGMVGPDAQPWCEVVERLSRSMRADLGYVVVPLLSRLCEFVDQMTEAQKNLAGAAARRILYFAWEQPTRVSGIIFAGLQAVCRTFASDPEASEALLQRALEPGHLAAHGYQEMPRLVLEIDRLIPIAPKFVERVYLALLGHKETSEEPVALYDSAILPLRSNRRQDYESTLYTLGCHFEHFSILAPIEATGAVIAAVEAEAARRAIIPVLRIEDHAIQIDGATGRIAEDWSHMWDGGQRHRNEPHLQMLDGFESMLVRIADAAAKSNDLRSVIDRVVRENRFAAVWRRVLQAATAAPSTLGMMVRSLAWSREVLNCVDTREPVGNFIKAVFPLLADDERERIERAILTIPDGIPEEKKQLAERNRDRLLGVLPRGDIVTSEATARLSELDARGGAPANAPPFQMGEITRTEYTARDWMVDQGVKVDEPRNARLFELQRRAGNFASEFLNGMPAQDRVCAIAPTLHELIKALDEGAVHADEPLNVNGWTALAGACAAIARAECLRDEVEAADFVRTVLLRASEHEHPAPDATRDEDFERNNAVSPTPRWYAAEGLCRLACSSPPPSETVLAAIERLSRDRVAEVRAEVGSGLGCLAIGSIGTALRLLQEFGRSERNRRVLLYALRNAQVFLEHEPEALKALVMEVFERAGEGELGDDLRVTCLRLTVLLNKAGKGPLGGEIVELVLGDATRFKNLTVFMVQTAANYILSGPLSTPDPRAELLRLRSIEILTTIAREAADMLKLLEEEWKRKGDSTEDEKELARCIHSIAHEIGIRLQFAMKSVVDRKTDGVTPIQDERTRFLEEAAGLLDVIQEIPLATVAHRLLELFEQLLDVSPQEVLLRIAETTRVGATAGYQFESLGADLAVKLVQRYLADHRRLLQEDANCREALVKILDTFVGAGWTNAMGLTFHLEEIFR